MQTDYGDRQDPCGGVAYNGYDRVRLEYVYRQSLEKERLCKQAADTSSIEQFGSAKNFQMNFANQNVSGGVRHMKYSHNRIENITEKEHKSTPKERLAPNNTDQDCFELMAFRHQAKTPQQKYDVGVTAAQEIGWLLGNPCRSSSLQPPIGKKVTRRQIERMKIAGRAASTSELFFSRRTSSMPTSDRAMTRIRTDPHITGDPPHTQVAVLNNPRFRRPKGTCAVTRYAEAYYKTMGCDPFQRPIIKE